MSVAVKSHQAFFLAARTDHAAGLVPTPRSLPCCLPEHSFAAALPSPVAGGERRRKNAPRLPPNASHGAVLRWCTRLPSAGVRLGPGARPERPSIRVGPATAPNTCYRVRVERPARQSQEPTHRTNGAFTGSPGGTTAALSDLAFATPAAGIRLPQSLVRGVAVLDTLPPLTPVRLPPSRVVVPSNSRTDANPFPPLRPVPSRSSGSATRRSAVSAPTPRCRSSGSAYSPSRTAFHTTGSRHSSAANATRARPAPRSGCVRACCPPC